MARAKILRDGVQLHLSPTLGPPALRTFQRGHVVKIIRLCETKGIKSAEIKLRDGQRGYIAADTPRITFRSVFTDADSTIIYRDQSTKEILLVIPRHSPLDLGETWIQNGEKWVEAATDAGLFGF